MSKNMNLFDKPSAETCLHRLCRGEKRCENRTNHTTQGTVRRTGEAQRTGSQSPERKCLPSEKQISHSLRPQRYCRQKKSARSCKLLRKPCGYSFRRHRLVATKGNGRIRNGNFYFIPKFCNIRTFHFNIADFFISLWQISSE